MIVFQTTSTEADPSMRDKPYNLTLVKYGNPERIEHTRDAFLTLRNDWRENESSMLIQFKALIIDKDNNILGKVSIPPTSKLNTDYLEPVIELGKEIGGVSIITCQDKPHPSLYPNKKEKLFAQQLKEFGEQNNMPVKDHFIMTSKSYYSFANNGLI